MSTSTFKEQYYTLKEVMDDLVQNAGFHISYPSLRQFYLNNSLNKDITQYITEKRKAHSTSYYVEKSKLGEFKEALFRQFL